MIEISIPGDRQLLFEHLVLDYNGTLALDGHLLQGVKETLKMLAASLQIHILTADTFGNVTAQLSGIPVELSIIPIDNQDQGKLEYIQKLGADATVSIGNGRNDRLMLKASILGIAVIQTEGACVDTLLAADVVCPDILSALDLLIHPQRLAATLRL